MTLLDIPGNLFNIWLNRRQLGLHIHFCAQSVMHHAASRKLHHILMRE